MDDPSHAYTRGPLSLITAQRWSLAIIATLAPGPLRFSALKAAIRGLSGNLLARRLEALAEAGIVQHIELPAPASVRAYALTRWGTELGPILDELEKWSKCPPPATANAVRAADRTQTGAHP